MLIFNFYWKSYFAVGVTFYHMLFFALLYSGFQYLILAFLFHGLQALQLSFMCTVGSRKSTDSEVISKKFHPIIALKFWGSSVSLYLQIIVGIKEACMSINTVSDFLLFRFAFTITGQLQIFPCWHSLSWLGYLDPIGIETLYAGTQIMKWYGSNITCIIMLQFMLKKEQAFPA